MIEISRIKEVLKEKQMFKLEYFDKKKYFIDSFIQTYEIIFYVYESALGTAKLQGQSTNELETLVYELKRYKGESILSVSINPLEKGGDYLTILIEPPNGKIIGVHSKIG